MYFRFTSPVVTNKEPQFRIFSKKFCVKKTPSILFNGISTTLEVINPEEIER